MVADPVCESWWTSMAEPSSSRWASSTKTSRGRPHGLVEQLARVLAQQFGVGLGPGAPGFRPRGRSEAKAPKAKARPDSVPATAATAMPCSRANSRPTVARAVLPTPAGPVITAPWRSAMASRSKAISRDRPTSGHAVSFGPPPRTRARRRQSPSVVVPMQFGSQNLILAHAIPALERLHRGCKADASAHFGQRSQAGDNYRVASRARSPAYLKSLRRASDTSAAARVAPLDESGARFGQWLARTHNQTGTDAKMIPLTRLNGDKVAINPDRIERADITPDVVLTMTDGSKFVVAESLDELIDRIRLFRASVLALSHRLVFEGDDPSGEGHLRVVRGAYHGHGGGHPRGHQGHPAGEPACGRRWW